jgi:hypothetical protein
MPGDADRMVRQVVNLRAGNRRNDQPPHRLMAAFDASQVVLWPWVPGGCAGSWPAWPRRGPPRCGGTDILRLLQTCDVLTGTAYVADPGELDAVAWAAARELSEFVQRGFYEPVEAYLCQVLAAGGTDPREATR